MKIKPSPQIAFDNLPKNVRDGVLQYVSSRVLTEVAVAEVKMVTVCLWILHFTFKMTADDMKKFITSAYKYFHYLMDFYADNNTMTALDEMQSEIDGYFFAETGMPAIEYYVKSNERLEKENEICP